MFVTSFNAAAFSGKPPKKPLDFKQYTAKMRPFDPIEGHTGLAIYPGLLTETDKAKAIHWVKTQPEFHPRDASVLVVAATKYLDRLREKGHWVIPRTGSTPVIVHRTVVKQLRKANASIVKILRELRAVQKTNRDPSVVLSRAKKFTRKNAVLKALPKELNIFDRLVNNTFDRHYSEEQVAQMVLRGALVASYNQQLVADPTSLPSALTQIIEETPSAPMRRYEASRSFKPVSTTFLSHQEWKPKNQGQDDTGDDSKFSLAG